MVLKIRAGRWNHDTIYDMSDPRLHHYSQQIVSGTLEDVIDMYKQLGFMVVYRPEGDTAWAMVGQEQLRFAIQIVEVNNSPILDIEEKRKTHIAFISDNPQAVIDKIKRWAEDKSITFREGGWSDTERYFDLPGLFVNFVIEVMHTSIEDSK